MEVKTLNKNFDANFNTILHNNVHGNTAKDRDSGFFGKDLYSTHHEIKEVINECFIEDIIFHMNSLYKFYEADSAITLK